MPLINDISPRQKRGETARTRKSTGILSITKDIYFSQLTEARGMDPKCIFNTGGNRHEGNHARI